MIKLKIHKKDTVMVISGKDKGKKGEVLKVFPAEMRVLVSKVNIVTKHKKPRGAQDPGGIQKKEAPVSYSNVMLVCPKCDKAMRVKTDRLPTGERVRICRKCGETIL